MQTPTHVLDRAVGALLGQACGDALGVPYELEPPLGPDEQPRMQGGGLGDLAPGEWSDDTAMAMAVADGLLEGAGLDDRLERVARGFLDWYTDGPPDIGVQTQAVLAATRGRLEAGEQDAAATMRAEAAAYAASHAHAAGNGALMRTSPVALAYLEDRDGCATAARAIAELTHADPLAGDSCVLWSEAIRVAVAGGGMDLMPGLDLVPESRRSEWRAWLDDALAREPERFTPNGFTVHALQAAYAVAKRAGRGPAEALSRAVRIGDDTDTVAAITGGLLGGYFGERNLPGVWIGQVHGWPGRRLGDLVDLAVRLVGDGEGEPSTVDEPPVEPQVVPHPHDPGVYLGNTAGEKVTAVVELRVPGVPPSQVRGPAVVDCWAFLEREALDQGPFLRHAAETVRRLREAGEVVLVSFPTPHAWPAAVAMTYSTLLGHEVREAWKAMSDVWPWVGSWHVLFYSVRDLDGER